MQKITVRAEWDSEAKVWVATSDDVPGLATEANNLDELVPKLKVMIPELLELNGAPDWADDHNEVPISLLSHCEFTAHATA